MAEDACCSHARISLYSGSMHNPLVKYLIGACILSVGLVILLSATEIAHGLTHFWEHWLGKHPDESASPGTRVAESEEPQYRTRLLMWRALGALIVIDGFVWLARATSEVFRLMAHAKR
ncbi:MAG TPA: hypothetical protein VGU63_16640 [Candidatus Acidoferrales bacterium]|nr:hypothetical protein [Candidatus Acidoferrales bacterium]